MLFVNDNFGAIHDVVLALAAWRHGAQGGWESFTLFGNKQQALVKTGLWRYSPIIEGLVFC